MIKLFSFFYFTPKACDVKILILKDGKYYAHNQVNRLNISSATFVSQRLDELEFSKWSYRFIFM